MFAEKMRGGSPAKRPVLPTISSNKIAAVVGGKKRPASPSLEEKSAKRVAIKALSRTASKSVSSVSFGKSASKIKAASKFSPKVPTQISSTDSNVPVPMHVAMASVRDKYPGRRQQQSLEPWEVECLKLHRQLLRHPWISFERERPKYIFHVPVHDVFPEIRVSYASKIKRPMDLTTVESKLLQGSHYLDANEFISDVALVFSNAITFNKEGCDVGDPTSCAYHEVSTHLLKYTRWLSLELLQPHFSTCSDSPVVEGGCVSSWKLTEKNRAMARKEMESIVFAEFVERTEPGEKFSWTEQECERLLKSLRLNTDMRQMSFFVPMSFPADYTAFISKPIAWDKCKDKLYERKYNTIGEVVADLRLIFSNALKYNEGARHSSEVSQAAYLAAIHMSKKLEAAIDKLLVNVADKIGRERIDMIISHRELEALERAEEERRKLQWEKENPGSKVEVRTTLRIVNPRNSLHRKMSDFEFPFYNEDNNRQEESQADALQHAKSLYEKQRKARANIEEIALSIGVAVFKRLQERAAARTLADKEHAERARQEKDKADAAEEESRMKTITKLSGSFVSAALNDSNRKQVKLSIQRTKKLIRNKRPILWTGDD